MNINRLSVLTVCFAMSLAVIAGPVDAKENNNKSKGYPNGRGWKAVEYDFKIVKRKLNRLEKKVDVIDGKLDYIAEEVSIQNNVLTVQVSHEKMKPDVTIDGNYKPIVLIVQVIRNGLGLTKLTAGNFKYVNSFTAGPAYYCGAPCFTRGRAGQYRITLEVKDGGNWKPGRLVAGTLSVKTEYDDMKSHGTSQVVLYIPKAP